MHKREKKQTSIGIDERWLYVKLSPKVNQEQMDWSSDPHNKPVAIIVPPDPNVCDYNEQQRTDSYDVLNTNNTCCCVNVWYAKVLWVK